MTPIELAAIRCDLYDSIAMAGFEFEPEELFPILEAVPDDLIEACDDERNYSNIIIGYVASQLFLGQAFKQEVRN